MILTYPPDDICIQNFNIYLPPRYLTRGVQKSLSKPAAPGYHLPTYQHCIHSAPGYYLPIYLPPRVCRTLLSYSSTRRAAHSRGAQNRRRAGRGARCSARPARGRRRCRRPRVCQRSANDRLRVPNNSATTADAAAAGRHQHSTQRVSPKRGVYDQSSVQTDIGTMETATASWERLPRHQQRHQHRQPQQQLHQQQQQLPASGLPASP